MITFCFNETLPSDYEGNLQEVFDKTLTQFSRLQRFSELKIERGIITSKGSSEIQICGTTLDSLVKGCASVELKRYALSLFTKYPIGTFYELEDIFDEETLALTYMFDDKDATDLAIASLMSWPLYSLPLSDSLKQDLLTIEVSDSNDMTIANFFGENHISIIKWIIEREKLCDSEVTLLKGLFVPYNCILSERFIEVFNAFPKNLRKAVVDNFTKAVDRNMLFPIRSDDGLIKKCQGVVDTYELRSYQGPRVYFSVHDDTIIIASLHTKAESEGVEQTADIKRAYKILVRLKEKN